MLEIWAADGLDYQIERRETSIVVMVGLSDGRGSTVYATINRSLNTPGMWESPQVNWGSVGYVSPSEATVFSHCIAAAVTLIGHEFNKIPITQRLLPR